MSKNFEECIKDGGEIKTKQVSKNRYRRTCTIKGKTHLGEILTRK